MLKTSRAPTSFLLPERLKLVSLADCAARRASALSTASSSESLQQDPRQPILLASHHHHHHHRHYPTTMQSQPRRQMPAASYFPLGYKEAAQQWVSVSCVPVSRLSHRLFLSLFVFLFSFSFFFVFFPFPRLTLPDRPSKQWASVSARQAERNVLSFVPFLREATAEAAGSQLQELAKSDPFGQRVWRSSMVQLSGRDRALNELAIERVGERADDTLVMLHGYGAGLGFFYKNFEPLSRVPGWRLFALDMLGMGNSARPPFRIHARDPKEKIAEAEAWFIDALEEWRRIRNIEKFTLLGHSLGGYLAVSYALKYPGRLNKLILASPVGIPEDPWAIDSDLPEPGESTMANEFTQDQESIVSGGKPNNTDTKTTATPTVTTISAPPKRPLPNWLVWLWDANVSPFSIVRLAGPLGPRLVSGWTWRRFNHLPAEERDALHTYSYALFRRKGSGEYALPYLLAPGAYARSPVIHRIDQVGRQELPPSSSPEKEEEEEDGAGKRARERERETGLPIVFLYGENDWMDVSAGHAAAARVRQRAERALREALAAADGPAEEEAARRRERGAARVIVVPRAGHHLYLDNPDAFNEVVRREMEETRADRLARGG